MNIKFKLFFMFAFKLHLIVAAVSTKVVQRRQKRQNYNFGQPSPNYSYGQIAGYNGQYEGYNNYQPQSNGQNPGNQYQPQYGQGQEMCPCSAVTNPSQFPMNLFAPASTVQPFATNRNLCPCSSVGVQPFGNPTQMQLTQTYPFNHGVFTTTPGFPFNLFAPPTTTPAPFPMNLVNQFFPPPTTSAPKPFPFNLFEPKPTEPPRPFPLNLLFPTTAAPFLFG